MRLTKEDGRVLLGAIEAELESQYWRQQRRSESGRLAWEVEQGLREQDEERKAVLYAVRSKIKAQL